MSSDAFTEFAQELALRPDVVRRILREHGPDRGGRCRVHHNRPEPHPCSIRALAELAAHLAAPTASPAPPVETPAVEHPHCDPASHCTPSTGCGPAPRPRHPSSVVRPDRLLLGSLSTFGGARR